MVNKEKESLISNHLSKRHSFNTRIIFHFIFFYCVIIQCLRICGFFKCVAVSQFSMWLCSSPSFCFEIYIYNTVLHTGNALWKLIETVLQHKLYFRVLVLFFLFQSTIAHFPPLTQLLLITDFYSLAPPSSSKRIPVVCCPGTH